MRTQRGRRSALVLCSLTLTLAQFSSVRAGPVVEVPGYDVSLVVSGVGAADGLAISPTGDLFITDYQGGRVLDVANPAGAGAHSFQVYATGIAFPTDLAFNNVGNLFVASSTSGSSDVVQVFADGHTSVFASGFSFPSSIKAFGADLYVTSSGNDTIQQIDPAGNVKLFANTPAGGHPYGISFDGSGNGYFTLHDSGGIYERDTSGTITLLGSRTPFGVSFTTVGFGGQLFVSDSLTESLLVESAPGAFTTFANGFVGKSNPPSIGPTGLVYDGKGNLYVGDGPNVWRISETAAVPEPPTLALAGIGLAVASVLTVGLGRPLNAEPGGLDG